MIDLKIINFFFQIKRKIEQIRIDWISSSSIGTRP